MARSSNMSFLPEDYLERRAARRTNLICITLFVIVVGGVVGAYWMTYQRAGEIRRSHQHVNAAFVEAAERLEQLDELQERKHRTINKAEVTSALVEQIPRTLLLAELINHMPMEMGLLELELETRTIRREAPRTSLERRREQLGSANEGVDARVELPQTEVNVYVEGVAPTDIEVAQFMSALSRHPMFDDLDLLFSEQTLIEQQTMRKFRIAMKLEQEVDFTRHEPTRVRRGLDHDPMADEIDLSPDTELFSPAGDLIAPASDSYDVEGD